MVGIVGILCVPMSLIIKGGAGANFLLTNETTDDYPVLCPFTCNIRKILVISFHKKNNNVASL